MKISFRNLFGCLVAAHLACSGSPLMAQNRTDEIEMVRSSLKADRKVVIAEEMHLTDQESNAFWPIYRKYRTEMDRVADGRVELALEYADLYPEVPEDRAKAMLEKMAALQKKAVDVRNRYLKKLRKVLPSSKVLRFAQLENRLDLAISVEIAAAVPLVPNGGGK